MIALLDFVFAIVGWIGAVFGPPLLAMTFWHRLAQGRWTWPVHLLFLPSVVFATWCFVLLIFLSAHDDGSGPPGLGLFLIFPSAMLVGSVTLYYAALLCRIVASVWRRINVG